MDFRIEFYETRAGKQPVRELLDDLKVTDPNDFAVVMAGLVKLQDRQNHREPLTKPLGNKLFELRHVGKLNTRIFWFFMERRSIVLVHGIRSKGRKIPASAIQTSQARMHDWLERNKDEQDEF